MTSRDRNVLLVVATLVVLAASWFLLVKPRQAERDDLGQQVSSAQQRLDTALTAVAGAQSAQNHYDEDYAEIVRLGKAVPEDDDMPSLVVQLEALADKHHINFQKIAVVGNTESATAGATTQAGAVASATGATASGSVESSSLPPGAVVGAAGFPVLPFNFTFTGRFFDMEKFLRGIADLTEVSADGKTIDVRGRLLTIDSVDLQAGPAGLPQVKALVVAKAYLLPGEEDLSGVPGASSGTASTGTAALTTTGADK